MPLETFSYITSLVQSNPIVADAVSQGDDHVRGIKTVLLNTFPNMNSQVSATPAQLNSIASIPGTYAPLASPSFTGTPWAPTAAAGTNNSQIATTANVIGSITAISLGYAQTWHGVGYQLDVVYTNSGLRPIVVVGDFQRDAPSVANIQITVNGHPFPFARSGNSGGGNYSCGSAIIPPGHTFYFTNVGGAGQGLTSYSFSQLS